jgi:hypothetical protein
MKHDHEPHADTTLDGTIDKLAYVVASIIAHRRAGERSARRLADFGR